jgi:anti-anti-sigma factor
MDIHIDQEQGKVPVTVMRVHGEIDRSNYEALVEHSQKAYEGGARNILLDLSQVPYMSSAGLVAMQRIIRVLNGEGIPTEEDGWAALRGLDKLRQGEKQKNFKLLKPTPTVYNSLDTVGFTELIEVFGDESDALASF